MKAQHNGALKDSFRQCASYSLFSGAKQGPSQAVWELLILLSWPHIALPCPLFLYFKTRTLDTVT